MARPKSPAGEPTRAELDILQVLWSRGPSTVREVNNELNKHKEVAYTSTLKIMQLMYEKKILNRDDSEMTHLYHAAVKENIVKKAMLKRFVESVYSGSSSALMLQLLGSKKTSKEELATLKELLRNIEKKHK